MYITIIHFIQHSHAYTRRTSTFRIILIFVNIPLRTIKNFSQSEYGEKANVHCKIGAKNNDKSCID